MRRPGERATEVAAPGPWHFATLVTPCPRCDAPAGERCCWSNGTERAKFHFERYRLARELANRPLKSRPTRT